MCEGKRETVKEEEGRINESISLFEGGLCQCMDVAVGKEEEEEHGGALSTSHRQQEGMIGWMNRGVGRGGAA